MKILDFEGPLKLTHFYRDSIEKISNLGVKVQAFEGQLSGRVPPPSSVRYVLTPPIPVSDLRNFKEKLKGKNYLRFFSAKICGFLQFWAVNSRTSASQRKSAKNNYESVPFSLFLLIPSGIRPQGRDILTVCKLGAL